MLPSGDAGRFDHRPNAFGFLRLLMASLVIVAHTPEIVDGNRSREPLTMLFGTLSFGDLAVNGFFLISGYLISASYLRSSSVPSYLGKRVARIYPGFAIAYLLSVFLVPVLAGVAGLVDWGTEVRQLPRSLLTVMRPEVPGVFAGTPHPNLNSPMWTIAYELRCYLLVIVLGMAGLLTRWRVVATLGVLAVVAGTFMPGPVVRAFAGLPLAHELGFTKIHDTARTVGMFLCGATVYLLRERIRFERRWLLLAAAGLVAGMFFHATASLSVATCGAFLLFAAADAGGQTRLARINDKTDISYGVYLYAWPVEKLLVQYQGGGALVLLTVETFLISILLGWLSWQLVEKRFVVLVRKNRRDKPLPAAS